MGALDQKRYGPRFNPGLSDSQPTDFAAAFKPRLGMNSGPSGPGPAKMPIYTADATGNPVVNDFRGNSAPSMFEGLNDGMQNSAQMAKKGGAALLSRPLGWQSPTVSDAIDIGKKYWTKGSYASLSYEPKPGKPALGGYAANKGMPY